MNIDKRKFGLLAGIVLLLALTVACVIALIDLRDKPVSTTAGIRVAITEDGFSPATIVIKQDTTVVWVNNTAAPRTIGATPYPDASTLPELKSKAIAPGDSYSFTFDSPGTYNFADYTRPTVNGSVQVK